MKSILLQSLRGEILSDLNLCRASTNKLFETVDSRIFCTQAHPDFSPVGWHFGHIAFTEAHWILEKCAGLAPLYPEYRRLFAADGLPKSQRQNLPSQEVIKAYLITVRSKVLAYLETAPLEKQERLWRWLLQHESQHGETISFILQLHHRQGKTEWQHFSKSQNVRNVDEMAEVPAGEFEMGYSRIDAQDNERPTHLVYLDSYWLDRYPVTCGQYRRFIEGGGYQNPQWWTAKGWQWLQDNPVSEPLYWRDSAQGDEYPVSGVSWYEADAYARFVGKRLPTEAEWEKAACWNPKKGIKLLYPWGNCPPTRQSCNHHNYIGTTTAVNAYPNSQSYYGCYDLLGNVWEWTNSWFVAYPRFESYPYRGYSQVYFDGEHRILRGGSWATFPWSLRPSFRNWYHPNVRQILAGFRCAVS